MKVLVLVLSFNEDPWKKIEEEGIRETWAKEEEVFYYYGGSSTKVDGDRWFFNVPESYNNISVKTELALNHLLANHTFDYVFRTNTSSYVDIDRLKEYCGSLPEGTHYAGVVKKVKIGEEGEFVSGAGILMSAEAVGALCKEKWNHCVSDDRAIGEILTRKYGRPVVLPRLDYFSGKGEADTFMARYVIKRHFHIRCKHPFNRDKDIEAMLAVHEEHKFKESGMFYTAVGLDTSVPTSVCFLVDKRTPYAGGLVQHRWRKFADLLISNGDRAVLRTETTDLGRFGRYCVKSLVDSLSCFKVVVFTYPVEEMGAVLQYLCARGVRTVLDYTDQRFNFHEYAPYVQFLDEVHSGNFAEITMHSEVIRGLGVRAVRYVPTPLIDGVQKGFGSEGKVRVLRVGNDQDLAELDRYSRLAGDEVSFVDISSGDHGHFKNDLDFFKDFRGADAIMVNDSVSSAIPSTLLRSKGIPILAVSGAHTRNTFSGGSALLLHSEDNWQVAFGRLYEKDYKHYWGMAASRNLLKGDADYYGLSFTLRGVLPNAPIYYNGDLPKINMLIRTSSRKEKFLRLIDSIIRQEYPNLNVIVSYDNEPTEDYVRSVKWCKPVGVTPGVDSHFYNDYLNHLLAEVEDGWVFFMDDDDLLFGDNTLKEMGRMIMSVSKPGAAHIFQMANEKDNMSIIPPTHTAGDEDKGVRVGNIGTPCFILPSDVAKSVLWDSKSSADGRYISEVVRRIGGDVVRHSLVTVVLPDGASGGCNEKAS